MLDLLVRGQWAAERVAVERPLHGGVECPLHGAAHFGQLDGDGQISEPFDRLVPGPLAHEGDGGSRYLLEVDPRDTGGSCPGPAAG